MYFGKSFKFGLSCVCIYSSSLNTAVTVYFNITYSSRNVSSIIQLPDEVCELFRSHFNTNYPSVLIIFKSCCWIQTLC